MTIYTLIIENKKSKLVVDINTKRLCIILIQEKVMNIYLNKVFSL